MLYQPVKELTLKSHRLPDTEVGTHYCGLDCTFNPRATVAFLNQKHGEPKKTLPSEDPGSREAHYSGPHLPISSFISLP